MKGLETGYAGLRLRSPLIVASSGLTKTAQGNKKLEDLGAGAIVLKSLFEEQIESQSDALLQASDAPEAADYVRNYVRANQIEDYLNLIRESKSQCSIPVIASINCYKSSAWTDFAVQIEAAGADAIELNVFYLCTDLNTSANEMYELYVSILGKIRKMLKIPVIMKIGKGFSNIPGLVSQLWRHKADGVVLFNRYCRPDIDINTMKVISGEVFSTPAELGDTLRWTAIVSGLVPDVSIAASTGVHSADDVVKCLLAGASAVQLCSTLYKNGVETLTHIADGLQAWMDAQKFRSVSDFRGRLSFNSAADPSLYERAQFMKHFSSRV